MTKRLPRQASNFASVDDFTKFLLTPVREGKTKPKIRAQNEIPVRRPKPKPKASGEDAILREEAASMNAEGNKLAAKHEAESEAQAGKAEDAIREIKS